MDVDGNRFVGNYKHSVPTTPLPRTSWQKAEDRAKSVGYTAGVAYTTKSLWMPLAGGILGGLSGGMPGAEAGFALGVRASV